MRRKAAILRILLAVGALAVVVLSAAQLPAGLYVESTNTSVEIDGVNYGTFNAISGLNLSNLAKTEKSDSHVKVTLKRDFVTDQSLYKWALNISKQRQGLKDVHLVKRNESGEVVSRYVLKLCQPLSWTVEAANPALGGFHETVELAVQNIQVY